MITTGPTSNWTSDKLADWIEYQVLFSLEGSFSRATFRDFIDEDPGTSDMRDYDDADFSEDEDLGDLSSRRARRGEAAEGLSTSDALSTDAFVILEDRASFVGDHYPFRVEADLVSLKGSSWQEHPSYSFMLALSARFMYGLPGDFQTGARLFERLVRVAMAEYIHGEAEHFGWPRDGGEGERSFAQVLPLVLRRLGERMAVKPDDIPDKIKDNEVDVIAWRPPGDRRRGQLIVMCQCAIGADWNNKGIRLDKWEPFVGFAVRPVAAAAFPFIPASIEEFGDFDYEYLSKSAGLWFDRLRLTRLITDSDLDENLRDRMISYVQNLVFAPEQPTANSAA
jgi:hypothetical protein